MTVTGSDGTGATLSDPGAGAGVHHNVTIPRWPSNVYVATGDDKHATIFDPIDRKIYSFYGLNNVGGQWRASQYGVIDMDGTGWGTPQYRQPGLTAVGTPAISGNIRTLEVDDGAETYPHALAFSLDFGALSPNPLRVFPATSADSNGATTNYGQIPEGSRLMLPPSFDTSTIANLKLRKVANTLKLYGGYVVDRNQDTRFSIFVELGSGFRLHPVGGFDQTVANALSAIADALRVVTSTTYIGADGVQYTIDPTPQ